MKNAFLEVIFAPFCAPFRAILWPISGSIWGPKLPFWTLVYGPLGIPKAHTQDFDPKTLFLTHFFLGIYIISKEKWSKTDPQAVSGHFPRNLYKYLRKMVQNRPQTPFRAQKWGCFCKNALRVFRCILHFSATQNPRFFVLTSYAWGKGFKHKET